jgi:hypothetical protein
MKLSLFRLWGWSNTREEAVTSPISGYYHLYKPYIQQEVDVPKWAERILKGYFKEGAFFRLLDIYDETSEDYKWFKKRFERRFDDFVAYLDGVQLLST